MDGPDPNSQSQSLAPLVVCPAGALRGIASQGIERFAGIPFAHPPIGDLRFAPAQPLPAWSGELDASQFGPASAQVFDPLEGAFEQFGEPGPIKQWVGSENSLTLNIWRPSGGASDLPVLIWIHGGANWLASSRFSSYDGTRFAQEGVIFVSLNYRLGIFGFLDLSPIGGPAQAHSNGLTDQLAAINWVAANIAAFGGDPKNITLMGNSAGSMDISWLLASRRLPKGVRRLFLSSGVAGPSGLGRDETGCAHAPKEGYRRAADFLSALGYRDFASLQAAPTGEILSRHASWLRPFEGLPEADTLFYPRTGSFAPHDPFEAAAQGAGQGLDLILGFTAFEMGLWLLWDDAFDARSPEWAARAQVPFVPSSVRSALPDLYRQWMPDEPDGRRAMHMIGDAVFALPAIWMADLLSKNGAKVFLYRFDWQVNARLGALHAVDLPFLFGIQATPASERLIGQAKDAEDRARRDRLSETMRHAVLGFARSGQPEIDGEPWQRYDTNRRMTLLLDNTIKQVQDPLRERRAWWTGKVVPQAFNGAHA